MSLINNVLTRSEKAIYADIHFSKLIHLPVEVMQRILSFLPKDAINNLRQVCHFTAMMIPPNLELTSLFKRYVNYSDTFFEIAKKHIAENLSKNHLEDVKKYPQMSEKQRFQLAQCMIHKSPVHQPQEVLEMIAAYDLNKKNQDFLINLYFKEQLAELIYQLGQPERREHQQAIRAWQKALPEKYALVCLILEILTIINNSNPVKTALPQLQPLVERIGVSEKIFMSLSADMMKRDNPIQQTKDVNWLRDLIFYHLAEPNLLAAKESPLCDVEALPLLRSILKITNPKLREYATEALMSIYSIPEKTELLRTLLVEKKVEKKDYLHVAIVLLVTAGFEQSDIQALIENLPPSKYDNSAVMVPINELIAVLSRNQSLTLEKKQALMELIFKAPVKSQKEGKPEYNRRLTKFREQQQVLITALHALLYFGQDKLIENVVNAPALVSHWKKFMGETFCVKADALSKFVEIFGYSDRFPNGLMMYAARLQTLSNEDKNRLMPLLGTFTAAVLNGESPKIRYDFENNPHLKAVFSKNKKLLEKWMTPIKFTSTTTAPPEKTFHETPQMIVKRLFVDAYNSNHFGADHAINYPGLNTVLDWTVNHKEVTKNEVVLKCAKLLNPQANVDELIETLQELMRLLPDTVEFKHDTQGMLSQLTATHQPMNFTVEDSDAWEDLLLMGTEVKNSCQSILRKPEYNKCLLSYILDGKSRLIIARGPSGKIIGRVVLRILLDKKLKKPVLFMERLYVGRGIDFKSMEQSLTEGCREKARSMGLELVTSAKDHGSLSTNKYPGELSALGGPAPFEYVDALSGIQSDGKFSISDALLI